MENYKILYPDTDYQNLSLAWGRKQLDIYSVDKNGDIEIEMNDGYGDHYGMYLDQDQIKVLIEHLQKQLK